MVQVTIYTLNPDKELIPATVQILSPDKSKILYECKSKGICKIEIEKGEYVLRLIHCDTVDNILKAYQNHKKGIFMNDDCDLTKNRNL